MSSTPSPSDWQTTTKSIKECGQYILKTGKLSDCCLVVGTEPNQEMFPCHKLICAMKSPVFERMFFGDIPVVDPIPVLDVQPDAFKALLEYIYTDEIKFTSFDQAWDVFYAAKKYMFPHLMEECVKYLQIVVGSKNVCRAYELAKFYEVPILIETCMEIFRSNAFNVFNESSFEEADITTVLTIFAEDKLYINSELDLFSAITRYAARRDQITGELFNQNMATVNAVNSCLITLLESKDEESLECLCKLLTTLGAELENKNVNLDFFFSKMKELVDSSLPNINIRIRCMLQDVIDLRESKWERRRQEDSNPKTLHQIQEETENKQLNIQAENPSSILMTPKKDETGGEVKGDANLNYSSAIKEAVMKIRFLTLSSNQFANGPGMSNLLTESEKLAILMNIAGNSAIPMPKGFSTCKNSRVINTGGRGRFSV